jgi:ribonucleotide reductase alpha subunit
MAEMSDAEMKEELERLRAENQELKKRSEREITLKVSQKGGVSLYGLGRFPVTLYKEQWLKIVDMVDDIKSFIDENESKLKTKDKA